MFLLLRRGVVKLLWGLIWTPELTGRAAKTTAAKETIPHLLAPEKGWRRERESGGRHHTTEREKTTIYLHFPTVCNYGKMWIICTAVTFIWPIYGTPLFSFHFGMWIDMRERKIGWESAKGVGWRGNSTTGDLAESFTKLDPHGAHSNPTSHNYTKCKLPQTHIHINALYGDAVKVHLISPAMRN